MIFDSEILTNIKRFAEGKITYEDFELLIYTDSNIWFALQTMISDEMKADATHPIWSEKGFRMILEANNFSIRSSIEAFGLDTDFGRSRLHYVVAKLVSYHFPEVIIRNPKEQNDTDLLEQLKLDYITGCEVDELIEEIILSVPTDITKKERKSQIKDALKRTFHIQGNKRPIWAQEPEWPMGKKSPMAYVSKKTDGDLVRFTFRDVDTGEERIVEQLY